MNTETTTPGLLIAIGCEDWQTARLSSRNAFEALHNLLYEVYFQLGVKQMPTEGRTILIDLGFNDFGRPGPAAKLSQVQGVHIIGKHQIIQSLQTGIGRLANKRRYITVLVTGRHGDDLLKDYIRSDRDLVMHLIDLRYSGLESRGRGITEAATDHNCSRPQHTTGYEPANRVPAENDPSETFSDGDSAPPLSLAEIKRMQTMGILPLPHGLSSVMFCPAEVPPTTARAMPPLTALPGSYR